MKTKNVSFSIGNVVLIDKVNAKFGFFSQLFSGIAIKAKNLKESAKLFSYNRLSKCVSINRLLLFILVSYLSSLVLKKLLKIGLFIEILSVLVCIIN